MNDVIMKDSFEEKKQPIEEKKQANEEKKPKPKAAEPPKDRTAKEKSKETKETPNVKVSRSREEDEHVAPPSKRARTEESQDGDHSGRASGTGLTKPQHRYAISLLRNIKRTKDAGPFLYPVDHEALNIPTYPEIIKHPMDISTIESKLNHNEYANTDQFIADFNLMIENCYTFNGPEHPVAHMANAIRIVFEKGIKQMPAAERHEPPTPEKKHTPTTSSKKKASSASKKPTTQSAAPATPAAAATATSSKKDNPKPTKKKSISVAPSTQTFAVGPSGIPLIRRESAASDRPKREIHPPPPRDLPYDVKPRRKKVATELKFCDLVLRELLKRQHQGFAFVFYSPVDPVALNIPDYFKIIRKPMDLQTIGSKLKTNQYNSAQEFEQDVRLMLSNCFKFNPPGSVVHGYGKKVEEIFNAKWKEKAAYIQANTSQDSPASASPVPEEEVMSEEEEEPVEDESKIKLLEKQLAEMQEQLTLMKKKGSKAPKESSSKKSKTAQRPSISQPVPAKKSTSSKKSTKKEEKQPLRQLTVEEKYELSEKINSLPPNKLVHVTKLIRDNMELAVSWTCLISHNVLTSQTRMKPMTSSSLTWKIFPTRSCISCALMSTDKAIAMIQPTSQFAQKSLRLHRHLLLLLRPLPHKQFAQRRTSQCLLLSKKPRLRHSKPS